MYYIPFNLNIKERENRQTCLPFTTKKINILRLSLDTCTHFSFLFKKSAAWQGGRSNYNSPLPLAGISDKRRKGIPTSKSFAMENIIHCAHRRMGKKRSSSHDDFFLLRLMSGKKRRSHAYSLSVGRLKNVYKEGQRDNSHEACKYTKGLSHVVELKIWWRENATNSDASSSG